MLKLRQLTQRYGQCVALNALSFDVARGSFVVLLGPNGAGKSTLFQVLTGLFAADAGDVGVAGLSMRSDARRALAHIGVVFQQPSLDLDLSVAHNLQVHADLQGLPREVAAERIAFEAARFGLLDEVHRRGVTVLWATHLVPEAEDADRVLVLHRGELLADGTPTDVTAALGGPTLEAAFIHATTH